MHRKRTLLLGTVVAVAGLAAAGCGGSSGGSQSEPASTSGNAQSSGSPKTVTVSETEYKLTPGTLKLGATGTYTIKIVNTGSVTHALEVAGNGVEQKSGNVDAGKSATLTVDFKKTGSYEMYCPIDGHRQQGMEGKITVGSAASGGMTTGSSTETHTTTSQGYGY
jgi:plastocyanin